MNRYPILVLTLSSWWVAVSSAADWPMYARDARRSNVTEERLGFPLHCVWSCRSMPAPRPAWPEPVKNLNRVDFDYAAQPVVAGGVLYVGSSADDTVRALDAATGHERWHFIAGGPVRFAPQVARDRVYVASDDGFVYCLEAAAGKLLWKFFGGMKDERLLGNERMISRWPMRCGVLVDDGVVYCVAGMWPAEGVFVYALEAATGKVLWCNDTSSAMTLEGIHESFTLTGICPQGALLLGGDVLLVPNGRGIPAGFDRRTGKLLWYDPSNRTNCRGGTWLTIDGPRFFTYSQSFYSGLALAAFDVATGKWLPKDSQRVPGHSIFWPEKQESHYHGKTSVVVHQGKAHGRLAYGLVLAGPELIVGEDGAVVAVDAASKKEVWRATVDGKARGLAVADGNLFVITESGAISCFSSRPAPKPPRPAPEAAPNKKAGPPTQRQQALQDQLRAADMDRGYALVVGDEDAQWSLALVERTALHVVNLETSAETTARLRNHLLTTTHHHGSRICVQTVSAEGELPFASYFANAIVVAGAKSSLPARQLYRLLRPCGGLLLLPDMQPGQARSFLEKAGIPREEIQLDDTACLVRRGKLPEALDWDSPFVSDRRVKWPLRPIWFGGPGPAKMQNRKHFTPSLAFGNGRYFVMGDPDLLAVDAYNGLELWARPCPVAKAVHADDRHVYVTLDKACFHGQGDACIQLDARSGKQLKFFGPVHVSEQIALHEPRTWKLEIDDKHHGTLTLRLQPDGLLVELATTDPDVAPKDGWDLFFDFRPAKERYGLYGPGTFQIVIPIPEELQKTAWKPGAGHWHPKTEATSKRNDHGWTATIKVSWKEIEQRLGEVPPTFGFAATLRFHDGKPTSRLRRKHLFGDDHAPALNNGWATVHRDGKKAEANDPVLAGKIEEVPAKLRQWTVPRLDLPEGPQATRLHPLTGKEMPLTWQPGFFCGGISCSATSVFTRTGPLGCYDFVDDSGRRYYGGVKPACAPNSIAALGLWIVNEGSSTCECTYSFQTSLALAPAERRLQEDWAVFSDWKAEGIVRQAALNLGAPGDRRDDAGTLWLGFPRPATHSPSAIEESMPWAAGTNQWKNIPGVWQQKLPLALPVPLQLDVADGLGAYRVSADRVAIAGTTQPWIYTSGVRGVRRAVLQLDHQPTLASTAVKTAPVLDGTLDDDAWSGAPEATLTMTKTKVFVRHDADHLYLACERRADIDRKGAVTWTKKQLKEDSAIHYDDSWEVFLSDEAKHATIYLGVSASGARADARCDGKAKKLDRKWTTRWQSAVSTNEHTFLVEMAIPWKSLAEAGLDREHLLVNFQINKSYNLGEALLYLGPLGRERCDYFAPLGIGTRPVVKPRSYTVRLHFAELDNAVPGQRLFDVKLQGRLVMKDLDVVREAGGPRRALVKEFRNIEAGAALTLEFVTSQKTPTEQTAPILSGLELRERSEP